MSSSLSSKKDLFDEHHDKDDSCNTKDNDGNDDEKIRINKEYATQYQTRKELQELRQHGEDGSGSSSSSDESSEDEDGDLLTPTMDVTILKTINALRNKDESIYDANTRFFPSDDASSSNEENSGDDEDEPSKKKRRHKPLKYKDVVRQQILDQIKQEEESGTTASSKQQQNREETMSKLEYDEEQRALRSAFINSTKENEENQDDEQDWMVLKSKNKTNDKIDREANRLIQYELQVMEEQTTKDDNSLVDPRGEVENGQEFLLDFLKNKKWIDKTDQQDSDSNDDDGNNNSDDDDNNIVDNDDDSMEQLDRTDDFEAKYNFRFEEAAAAVSASGADHSMVSYARGNSHNAIPTLRRKDETRRIKRLQRKEKKLAERQQKEEQLRRLKNAKRHEMQEKYKQIQTILGTSSSVDEATMMKLLEGDYDPAQFEQAMEATYNDNFYQQDDTEWKSDEQVRESLLQDDDGVFVGQDNENADGGLYDNYNDEDEDDGEGDGNEYDEEQPYKDVQHDDKGEAGWEDENEYFDAEDDPDQHEQVSETEQRLKQKMMDELYKLDYEDIVAGMPTRFKYRNVEANNYGLSTREVLFARDTTLKQFVSLKKMAPYREEGEYHVTGRKRRRFREMVKHEMEEEILKEQEIVNEGEQGEEEEEQPTKKKRRRQKKKGKKQEETDNSAVEKKEDGETTAEEKEDETETATGKRKRKKKGSKKKKTDPASEKHHAETKPKAEPIKEEETIVPPLPTKESSSEPKQQPPTEMKDLAATKNGDKKKRKKRRKKKNQVEGVSASRLAAYGL